MYILCLAALVLGFAESRHTSRSVSDGAVCTCNERRVLRCTLSGPNDFVDVKSDYCGVRINLMELRLLSHTYLSSREIPGIRTFRVKITGGNLKQVSENAFVGHENGFGFVEISEGALSEVPTASLDRLRELRTLNLAGNAIGFVDCSLRDINLTALMLFDNQIATLHDCSFPSTLHRLNLKNNRLKALNGSLKYHHRLEWLFIQRNRITSLDGELDGLDSLSNLDAAWNRIEVIVTNPVSLPGLNSLNLSHNRISDLGVSLNGFLNLASLDLSNNDLETVKALSFANLTKLRFLSLSANSIRSLDDCVFGRLSVLRTLIISENVITSLDRKLDGLKSLKKLDASWNNIRTIGSGFTDLILLEHLDLSNNRIGYLGSSLNPLLQLKSLHLSFNVIEEVNEKHFRGTNLEILTLSFNAFGHLNGTVFASLPNLTTLDLSYNAYQSVQALMVPGFMGINLESNSSQAENVSKHYCKPRKFKTLRLEGNCRFGSDLPLLMTILEENGIELICS